MKFSIGDIVEHSYCRVEGVPLRGYVLECFTSNDPTLGIYFYRINWFNRRAYGPALSLRDGLKFGEVVLQKVDLKEENGSVD